MVSRYDLPHLDLSRRVQAELYTSAGTNPIGAGTARGREEHGGKLRGDLATAYHAFDSARRMDERLDQQEGVFLELEMKRGAKVETVERKEDGFTPGAARREPNGQVSTCRRFVSWIRASIVRTY